MNTNIDYFKSNNEVRLLDGMHYNYFFKLCFSLLKKFSCKPSLQLDLVQRQKQQRVFA